MLQNADKNLFVILEAFDCEGECLKAVQRKQQVWLHKTNTNYYQLPFQTGLVRTCGF